MRYTLGDRGDWFKGRLERLLGDGKEISFWEDVWVGAVPLKSKFPRLFHLCLDKDGKMGNMGMWEEGVWCWQWRWRWGWRRNLFEREMEPFNALI